MKFIHVGVGGFGQQWVRTLKASKAAEVVAMVDVSEKSLEAAREIGGYSKNICYSNLKEAMAHVKADAVVSTTPPAFHKKDVITSLKSGLHVISEKPMSDTLPACLEMVRTAQATGKTYVVSQNYRTNPGMWTLSKLIRSGKLGQVGQIKIDFYMGIDFGGGFRHEMPYPVIVDMAIHHFDLIRFITGMDAIDVQGVSWNPLWSNYKGDCSSNTVFTMSNNAKVLYTASWCAKGSFCDWNGNWQIECEKGTVTYSHGQIKLHRTKGLYHVQKVEDVKAVGPKRSGQDYVLEEFMSAVKTGSKSMTDCLDNIRSVSMVLSAVAALKSGKKVKVLDPRIIKLLE